jgi:CBS domain containing-hemolysin-like protein
LEGAVGHIIRGFQHDFPVVEGGRVVGLLPYRSLLRSLRERGSSAPVHQAMEPATFVGPDERLEQVLPRLQSAPCRCLLVVDARGALVGILSLENVGELVAVRRALSAVHHPPVQAQAA